MPRNTSGVYSLPQAAFIPNSLISSAAVNSDFSDIAVALTGSLPTDGSAGMTGPFKVGSGNVGAPGIAFTSDTNTGFYLAGTHQIGWSANGAVKPTLSSSQFNELTPSGWTSTSLVADDWIEFTVSGAPTSVQRVTVALTCTRTGSV